MKKKRRGRKARPRSGGGISLHEGFVLQSSALQSITDLKRKLNSSFIVSSAFSAGGKGQREEALESQFSVPFPSEANLLHCLPVINSSRKILTHLERAHNEIMSSCPSIEFQDFSYPFWSFMEPIEVGTDFNFRNSEMWWNIVYNA